MQLLNFIELFSKERIETYSNFDLSDFEIISVYKANLEIASSFYIPLHGLELVLRNKIHKELTIAFGEDWLFSNKVLELEQIKIVEQTKRKIRRDGKEAIISRVVAGLSFSFWEHLFSKSYEDLWRKHLYKIFLTSPKKFSRKEFHKRLIPLRKLRNRIAHYECILNCPIHRYYNEIIECIRWLNPHASDWTKEIASTEKLFLQHKTLLNKLYLK